MSFNIFYENHDLQINEEIKDNFVDLQNYIPIFNKFFKLELDNFNNITLNYNCLVKKIENSLSYNIYNISLKNNENKKTL